MDQPQVMSLEVGESSTANADLDLNLNKINLELILDLKSSQNVLNSKIKIIQIGPENLEEDLKKLDLKIFPNIFILTIEVKEENFETSEAIKSKVHEKFSKSHSILLQINSKQFLRKKNENFKELKLNLNQEEIEKNLNNSKFSTEIFLNIQKKSKITDWNFEKFLKLEKSAQKLFTFAINSQDDFCLRLLNLFNLKFSQNIRGEILHSVIRSRNLEMFFAFLHNFKENKIEDEEIENLLNLKCGKTQLNPFMAAVKSKNLNLVKFFLKYATKFPNIFNFSLLQKASIAAVEKEYFEIFSEIKKSLFGNAENLLEAIEQLHNDIESENLKNINAFCSEYPMYKLCYGKRQVCVLEWAIDCKKFKIFSVLRANFFYTDNESRLDEKIKNLTYKEKQEIRKENFKYRQVNPDAFIGQILDKCSFDALSPVSSTDISEMLVDLLKVNDLRPLLQNASLADLNILFDFANEAVNSADPASGKRTMGINYHKESELYVGKDSSKFERYGTFVHELTHQILFLIYENDCLPYCKGDTEREKLWEDVFKSTLDKYHADRHLTDRQIALAFQYSGKKSKKIELAVRVNHLLALYINEPETVEKYEIYFNELFDYSKNLVLPDFQIPNVLQLIQFNNDAGIFEELQKLDLKLEDCSKKNILETSINLIITSNVPNLAFTKIFDEIQKSSKYKLDLKTKNLFVDLLKFDDVKSDFYEILETSNIERIFFKVEQVDKQILNTFNDFENFQKIFITKEENFVKLWSQFEFEHKDLNFEWNDLTKESKEKILQQEIEFNGNKIKIKEFFADYISTDVIPFFCSNDKIEIFSCRNKNISDFYFERSVEKKIISDDFGNKVEYESFDIKNLIESTINVQVVAISDMAGSGKTFFLMEVHKDLLARYPQHLIFFADLKDHTEKLNGSEIKNFQDFIIQILNFNPLEAEIFNQKFSNGEVKILFDAFDEISPKYKEEILYLFKLFKAQDKNQIWITTRTHLEHELESELEIFAYKLKILDESQQIEFLRMLIKKRNVEDLSTVHCQKISKIILSKLIPIGCPLLLTILSKFDFQNIQINLIDEEWTLTSLFKKMFELNFRALKSKKFDSFNEFFRAHQYLAVVYIFDENLAETFGLRFNYSEKSLKEIETGKIIKFDVNCKIRFEHETFAESLLAMTLVNFLNEPKLKKKQKTVLHEILTLKSFYVTRLFLNDLTKDFAKHFKESNLFEDCDNILNILNSLRIERLFNVFKFVISVLKQSKSKNIQEVILKVLIDIPSTNHEDFKIVLNECQFFFGDFYLDKISASIKNFQTLLENLKGDNQKEILFYQNENQDTILHFVSNNFLFFQRTLEIIQNNTSIELQKGIIHVQNGFGQNIFHASILKSEKTFRLIFEIVESLFDKNEFTNFLNKIDIHGFNILHCAALHAKSKELLKFLWVKVCEFVENPKELFMQKIKLDLSILEISTQNDNPEIFAFIFEKAISFCNNEKEIQDLILGKSLLTYVISKGTKPSLEILFKKILEIFGKIEMKKLLNTTKGLEERNFLSLAAGNKDKSAIEFLWSVFEEKLSRDEIFELINQKDKIGENILHLAAAIAESDDIFKFLWLKIKIYFEDENELKTFLKLKDDRGRNILQLSTLQNNLNLFVYIFENVFCHLFDFNEVLYECFDSGNNLLHLIVSFSSLSIIKYFFNKLEEKLTIEQLKNYLSTKNEKNHFNLLHTAAFSNKIESSIELLFKMIERYFSTNEIKSMLTEFSQKYDAFPLHCAIMFNTSKVFNCFTKLYEKILTRDEITLQLRFKNYLEIAADNTTDSTMSASVEKFIDKFL